VNFRRKREERRKCSCGHDFDRKGNPEAMIAYPIGGFKFRIGLKRSL
jgi:hypothetical protein